MRTSKIILVALISTATLLTPALSFAQVICSVTGASYSTMSLCLITCDFGICTDTGGGSGGGGGGGGTGGGGGGGGTGGGSGGGTIGGGSLFPNNSGNTTIVVQNPIGTGTTIQTLLQRIFGLLAEVGAPFATIMVLFGAYQILFAAGDVEKVKLGKKTIIYAVIGYAILISAWGIMEVISSVLNGGGTLTN